MAWGDSPLDVVDDAIEAATRTLPANEAAAVRRDLQEAASTDRGLAAEKARAWLRPRRGGRG